ncbi:MAG: PQQ-binding-like beta-propeller repeat protein [Planctomycetota bacterium]|nr:PQQ-binding-like beta-propeller repeat protein [Planctomycetota bacterium]
MISRFDFFLAVFLVWNISTLPAQEWSRFRGNNGTGISNATTVPTSWKMKDLNWKTKLPGVGHSSPIQYGKTVFVLSADPENATKYVVAVNAKNGKIEWTKKFESSPYRCHRLNSYNSGTPAADNERLYVSWSDKSKTTLFAFTHDGKKVWQKELGTWVGQHGFAASPIVYQDKVIISNSQQKDQLKPGDRAGKSIVYAFDSKTGKLAWQSERVTTRVSYSVPCIYKNRAGQDELVCCNTAEGVYSLNPDNGKLNWSYDKAFDKRTVASPVIANGLILGSCGSGGGGNFVVAIQPGKTPVLKFKVDRNANYVPTPIAFNDLIFLVSDKGIASCVESQSGDVIWRERLKGEYWASPVCVNGRIFVINSIGEVTVFTAGRKFQKLGESNLGEKCHSTPAITGGKMILRTVSHLMSIGGPS